MSNPNNIRLRFAPSPTGFLHLGSLRSALFTYLLAKSKKGKFILRIEDTDQKREVAGASNNLIKVLKDFKIEFDEGPHLGGNYGPYIQSQRLSIYKKYSDQLLENGKAYRCFCSPERLQKMRQEQQANKEAPHYDRHCRQLSAEEIKTKIEAGNKFVIRQKMPLDGEVVVHDELRGKIKFPAQDLDDQILIKSNGVPTYQFANVVDDHLMLISHVTRGVEWLPSYPKNILLYQSFDWTPPKFIHLPLILNKDGGGKLSKRQGSVFVEDYLKQGYLPEALINFSVLLGWHPKNNQEIWSLNELEQKFSVKGLSASPAMFDLEKLNYFNSYYIRQKSITELSKLCLPYLTKAGRKINDKKKLYKIISLFKDRLKKLEEIVVLSDFIFKQDEYDSQLLIWKSLSLKEVKANLQEIREELNKFNEEQWTKENLEKNIINWIKSNNYKNGDYLWPLRVSLTGLKNSPSPFEVLDILGKKESLVRIEQALKL